VSVPDVSNCAPSSWVDISNLNPKRRELPHSNSKHTHTHTHTHTQILVWMMMESMNTVYGTQWFLSDTNLNAVNGTDSNTGNQLLGLQVTLFVIGSISLISTFLYIVYVILRTGFTFPWKQFFEFCSKKRVEEDKGITFRELWSDIKSKCYLVAHPVSRIFFCLQLSEFMSVTYILFDLSDYRNNRAICYYQYFVSQFFGLVKYAWGFMISIWMFCILVLRWKELFMLELTSHCIVVTVATSLTIIPILTHSVGDSGIYCWIKGDGFNKYLRLTYYIPLWIIMPSIFIIYITTLWIIIRRQCISFRQRQRTRKMSHLSSSIKLYIKLLGFPSLLVIIWAIPSIRRAIEFVWDVKGQTNHKMPLAILYIHFLTGPSNGFWNTMLLLFSELAPACVDYMRRNASTSTEQNEELIDADYTSWTDEHNEVSNVG
jgi:hypothetical protein